MPFAFSCISPHLQISTIKKLDYNDFCQFQQCSNASRSIGSTLKTKLPLVIENVRIERRSWCDPTFLHYHDATHTSHSVQLSTLQNLPVRITARKGSINFNKNANLRAIGQEIQWCNIRVAEVYVSPALRDHAPLELDQVDEIIKHLKTDSLFLHSPKNGETLSVDEGQVDLFGSVNSVQIGGQLNLKLLVKFCAKQIKFSDNPGFLSAGMINQYLKGPEVPSLHFKTFSNKFPVDEDFDELLSGLDATLIWTSASHRQSEFRNIGFTRLWNGRVYVVFNGSIYRLVRVDGNGLDIDRLDGSTREEAMESAKILLRRRLQLYSY